MCGEAARLCGAIASALEQLLQHERHGEDDGARHDDEPRRLLEALQREGQPDLALCGGLWVRVPQALSDAAGAPTSPRA